MADPTDSQHFRNVLGHFPTGVTVVAAVCEQGPVGLAVGSFASVSLDPPLVAWMCGKESGSWVGIEEAGAFAVSVLTADQVDVCGVFAGRSDDKFLQVGWRPSGGTGSPIIDGSLAWLDCEIDSVHEGGDHHIVVGRVVDLEVGEGEARPMIFWKGAFGHFGQ